MIRGCGVVEGCVTLGIAFGVSNTHAILSSLCLMLVVHDVNSRALLQHHICLPAHVLLSSHGGHQLTL